MRLLWDFFVVPMLFPCYFYDLSMGCLWDSYIGISMIFLSCLIDSYEIAMRSLWDLKRISMVLL